MSLTFNLWVLRFSILNKIVSVCMFLCCFDLYFCARFVCIPQLSKGYLTEDGTNSNRSSHDQGGFVSNSARPMGPLASAVAKARRASRSAEPPSTRTPMIGSSVMMSSKAKTRATPLLQTQSQHMSR